MKWKHFFCIAGPLCREFTGHQWIPCTKANDTVGWALMFSLICARTNNWVNNRDIGDLRYCHVHYDLTVMLNWIFFSEKIHQTSVKYNSNEKYILSRNHVWQTITLACDSCTMTLWLINMINTPQWLCHKNCQDDKSWQNKCSKKHQEACILWDGMPTNARHEKIIYVLQTSYLLNKLFGR